MSESYKGLPEPINSAIALADSGAIAHIATDPSLDLHTQILTALEEHMREPYMSHLKDATERGGHTAMLPMSEESILGQIQSREKGELVAMRVAAGSGEFKIIRGKDVAAVPLMAGSVVMLRTKIGDQGAWGMVESDEPVMVEYFVSKSSFLEAEGSMFEMQELGARGRRMIHERLEKDGKRAAKRYAKLARHAGHSVLRQL